MEDARVRTTINISEGLYRDAQARAATTGQTVSEFIEDALCAALRSEPLDPALLAPLPVFGGPGVAAGVDLAARGVLLDAMDDGVGPDALR